MGLFDDYINGLEGKENLDPLSVARDLHGLYNQEIGTREAKIEELTGTVAEKDNALTDLDGQLKTQKARNFDLAMQLPGGVGPQNGPAETDPGSISIDDLFKKG